MRKMAEDPLNKYKFVIGKRDLSEIFITERNKSLFMRYADTCSVIHLLIVSIEKLMTGKSLPGHRWL